MNLNAFQQAVARVFGAALVVSGLGWSTSALAQSCGPGETSHAFTFTGGQQMLTVPAGVVSARVHLSGAQGGAGRSGAGSIGGSPNSPGGAGGRGARVSGTLSVLPGDLLSIGVGGEGSLAVNPGGASGSSPGGIGGGGTDLQVNGSQAAIAAGGGGGGNAGWSTTNVIAGGAGGDSGNSGSAGADVPGGSGPYGGGGGTLVSGGAGGGGCSGFTATSGLANGQGGASFNFSGSFSGAGFGGGGGGGATVGYGGGGAGVGTTSCQQNWNGAGGGGAGGTSSTGVLTSASVTNGVVTGNGAALVCLLQDSEDPVITTPANIVQSTDAGQPTATITFPAPVATDNSGQAPTITFTPPAGNFAIGATSVTVRATDGAGNYSEATFSVTVNDTEQPTLSTPSNISQVTDAGQATAAIAFPAPVTADNSGVAPIVTFTPPAGNFPLGATSVTVRSTDGAGNFTEATFSVTVSDEEPPQINPPADIAVSTDPGSATAVVSYSATATDNSGLTPTISYEPPSGTAFPIGVTTVTVTAMTDDSDNGSSTDTFTVTVTDDEAPVIVAPANIVVVAPTGQDGANVSFVIPTPMDNSGGAVTVVPTHASGSFFPVGVTTVTITATDPSQNSVAASFTVTVNDAEGPVISNMPADITVNTDVGQNFATVSWTAPTATDNVPGVVLTSTHAPGDQFPLGTTNVTYTATDANSNVATASFVVTVTDDEAPVIVGLPSDITADTDAGQDFATVSWTAPTATDNAPGVTLTSTHAPGDQFPVGTTSVSYTATDANSNSTTETFAVTVNDAQPPVFTSFPADIETDVDYPQTMAVASWTEPTASDNLPGVTVTQTAGPPSGSSFPLGVTTITYEARDAAGSTVTDSFAVTVNQTTPGAVIFEFSGPGGGAYTVSSADAEFNFSLDSSGGLVSRTVTIRPGTYDFSYTVPDGSGVESASCTAGGTIDPAGMLGSLNVVPGAQITCSVSTLNSRDVATGMIGEFLQNRSALILENGPDVQRRLERLTGAYTNDGGVSALGFGIESAQLPFSVTLSESDAKFSYSLRRSRAAGGANRLIAGPVGAFDKSDRLDRNEAETVLDERFGARPGEIPGAPTTGSAATGSTGSAAAPAAFGYGGGDGPRDPMQHRFDIWVEGRMAAFSSKAGDGKFGIVHAGMDYLFTPSILAGIGVQMDWTSQEGAAASSEISGTGYMVGPYMTARLTDNFYFDGRAAWGQSFNQISPFGTFEDEFDAQRWLVTGALIGQYNLTEAWKVRPELRLSYFRETSDAYTDSLGVSIPSVSVETGTLEFGPTFTTEFQLENGFAFAPFFTIEGIWTFFQENTATAVSSQPGLAEEGVRAKGEIGGTLTNGNGLSLSGSLSYDGIGSRDYEAWGGKLRLGATF